MENSFLKFLKLDSLLDSIKGYIDARLQLFKIEVQEKAASVITTLIFIAMLVFCTLMMMMFLSIALGNFLNEFFGNTYMGFCLMGGFYLLIIIILILNINKGFLYKKVRSALLRAFTGNGK